jgi:MFS family permease
MSLRVLLKVFNVYDSEIGRTSYAWMLRFIHKFGLVTGWTTVIALFVARYSIESLPFLFLVQAALMISGTIFYSFIADRFESRNIIIATGFVSAILLMVAGLFFENDRMFFPLVLIANGFFLQQISVFLSSYIEDIFSPVEASRVFPVIESAETLAGVFAGIVLAAFLSELHGQAVFFLWAIAIIGLIGVLVLLHPKSSRFYSSLYEMKILPKVKRMDWNGIKKSVSNITKIPFLQIMASVFLIQWFVAQLIEYQFTKVVDEGVLNASNSTIHAESLTHGLAVLQVLFFGSALFVQLLLASRILRFLGTVGGLLFHTIMTFLSAFSMMVGFGYLTTVMTKNNFEVSGVISKNAYEASYYAFPHGTQKNMREFFEGILAPVATMAGTLFLLLTGRFFLEKDALLATNVVFLLVSVFMVVLSIFLQKSYTVLVRRNLREENSRISKLNAIAILEEKGHLHGAEALAAALTREQDPIVIVRILGSLGRIGCLDTIPAIEKMVENGFPEVRIEAVTTLGRLRCLKSGRKDILVTRHRLVEKMKGLYSESRDPEFNMVLIRSLCMLEEDNVAGLLEMMKSPDSGIKIECMDILGKYGDKSALEYLKPLMYSNDYFVKAKALMTILGISRDDPQARMEMGKMLRNDDSVCRQAVLAEFWRLPSVEMMSMMRKALESHDPLVRLYASTSLIRSGNLTGAAVLADLLLFQNNLFFGRAKMALKGMDIGTKKTVAAEIERAMMLKKGLNWNKDWSIAERLELMGEEMLMRLKKAFELIGLDDEIELIKVMLEYRESSPSKAPKPRQILLTENVT